MTLQGIKIFSILTHPFKCWTSLQGHVCGGHWIEHEGYAWRLSGGDAQPSGWVDQLVYWYLFVTQPVWRDALKRFWNPGRTYWTCFRCFFNVRECQTYVRDSHWCHRVSWPVYLAPRCFNPSTRTSPLAVTFARIHAHGSNSDIRCRWYLLNYITVVGIVDMILKYLVSRGDEEQIYSYPFRVL